MQLIDKITQAQTGFYKDKRHFLDIYWIIGYKFSVHPINQLKQKQGMLKSCERGIPLFFAVVKFTLYPLKAQCKIVDKRIGVMVVLRSGIAKN